MGPRKKAKPNAPEASEAAKEQPSNDATTAEPSIPSQPQPVPRENEQSNVNNQHKAQEINRVKEQVENRRSWYGSWNQKSQPTAELFQELSSSAPVNQSLDLRRRPSTPSTPHSPKRLMSGSSSVKDMPLAASTTRLDVTSKHNSEADASKKEDEKEESSKGPAKTEPDPPLPPHPRKQENAKPSASKDSTQQQRAASVSWFGWWSRPDDYDEKEEEKKRQAEAIREDAQNTPLPGLTPQDSPAQSKIIPSTDNAAKNLEDQPKPVDQVSTTSAEETQGRSWFWLWSKTQNAQTQETVTAPQSKEPRKPDNAKKKESEQSNPTDKAKPTETPTKPPEVVVKEPESEAPKEPLARRKSNSWAFWSKEKSGPEQPENGTVHKQVGEIAVADTPSQSHPEIAQFNEQESPVPKDKDQLKPKANQSRGRKDKETLSKPSTPTPSTPAKGTPSQSPTRKSNETAPSKQLKQAAKSLKNERVQPDVLLPEFRNTYSLLSEPSFWEKIRRFFVGDAADSSAPHLHIAKDPPRIKKAIAIGIHGFFPSSLFQKVLGPPTGTSIRFSNQAAGAIKAWCEERGWNDVEIEKVALEGEGFVQERVDTLWKLLLNWIEHIRQADFILIAAHSQGVPVAIMLIAKLISFGCVNAARVGVCAMAGINLGPFAEYRTRMFGASAFELFEFSNPESKVSKMYTQALEEVLKFGVRIVYVGSIDDQLVSLESSTFSNISHPYIYRAVFIDGRVHSPDL